MKDLSHVLFFFYLEDFQTHKKIYLVFPVFELSWFRAESYQIILQLMPVHFRRNRKSVNEYSCHIAPVTYQHLLLWAFFPEMSSQGYKTHYPTLHFHHGKTLEKNRDIILQFSLHSSQRYKRVRKRMGNHTESNLMQKSVYTDFGGILPIHTKF